MKLKKLLPLASIAGVAAVVAPLVTSCGTKTIKYMFNEDNPAKTWHPDEQIAASTETKVYESKALTFYLEQVKKNKKILADDIVYNLLTYVQKEYEEDYIEEGSCEFKIGNIDPKLGKMSFSYDLNLQINTEMFKYETLKYSIGIENLEFVMMFDQMVDNKFYWSIIPFAQKLYYESEDQTFVLAYLKSKDDWSITYMLQLPDDIQKETRITINSKSSDQAILGAIASPYVYPLLTLEYSYYLFNVQPTGIGDAIWN